MILAFLWLIIFIRLIQGILIMHIHFNHIVHGILFSMIKFN